MRIACIGASWLPGIRANAIQLMKVCHSLVELKHEVKLWVPDFGGDLSWPTLAGRYGLNREFRVHGLPQLPGLGRNDFAVRALSHANRWGPDLLYVWPLQCAGIASVTGRPTLLEMHDRPSGILGPWWFRAFLRGSGARRLLVTTSALERTLIDQFGGERLRNLALIAPNGVDLTAYADLPSPERARDQLGLVQSQTAVYTGHLYEGRGVRLILALAKKNPSFQFVLAGGDAATVERWRSEAERQRVENLKLMGFVEHSLVPLVQAAGEVLLMPYGTRIEVSGGGDSSAVASPMKTFEYLATGRAILSSDLPVLREVLDETIAALLPPEDPEEWNAKLRELMQDEAKRSQLGTAARRRAASLSWIERSRKALRNLEL